MSFYSFEWTFFVAAIALATGLQWYNRRGANAVIVSQDFKRFQWLWLLVYYIVMCTPLPARPRPHLPNLLEGAYDCRSP